MPSRRVQIDPDTARAAARTRAGTRPTTAPSLPRRAWAAHPRAYAVLAVLAGAGIPLGVLHVTPLTAELFLLVGLTAYAAVGRSAAFAWTWAPWLAAVVLLDDLRDLQRLAGPPHVTDAIAAERALSGGTVPTLDLQAHWATPGALGVHDVALSLVYLLHSPAPLLCGAALFTWRRDLFGPFVVSLLLCATVGLGVYLAFPESPPWLAADDGVLGPVRRITSEVIAHVGPLDAVYGGADPLPSAAMPSLHVAYPVLVATWMVAAFELRALPVIAYPLSVAVGVVYLGEHYVIDVLAGIVIALAASAVAARISALRTLPERVATPSGARARPAPPAAHPGPGPSG